MRHSKVFLYSRRLAGHKLIAICAVALAGCTNQPESRIQPPMHPTLNSRENALRDLGFRPTDQGWEFDLGGRIVFPVNDSALSADALATIERLAHTLSSLGISEMRIEGHADNQGSSIYNQRLSERRAQAVARAFVARGFDAARMTQKGYGFSRPVADNFTEAGRQQNRRVTLIVSSL